MRIYSQTCQRQNSNFDFEENPGSDSPEDFVNCDRQPGGKADRMSVAELGEQWSGSAAKEVFIKGNTTTELQDLP